MHILRGVDYQVAHKKALKLRWLFAGIGWGFIGGFMKNFWVLLVLCLVCFAGSFLPTQVSAQSCTLVCKKGMFLDRVWTEEPETCKHGRICLANTGTPCPCNCAVEPTCVNKKCEAECVEIPRKGNGTLDPLGILVDEAMDEQQQSRTK
jgi:hypothetical protein